MGYVWTVYPRSGLLAMLATGICGHPVKARACVQTAISNAEVPAWGSVTSPGGATEVCSLTDDGEFSWGPLFPDLRLPAAVPEPGEAEKLREGSDLARLVRDWGHCYKLSREGEWWVAERRDNGARSRQTSAELLRWEIEDDHAGKPVPERYRLAEAG